MSTNPEVLSKIKTIPFTNEHFVDQVYPKNQIFLHHTASDGNPFGCVEYWKRNSSKVATAFLIAGGTTAKYKDGDIFQCFPSNKGGWHLGVTKKHLEKGGPNHITSTALNMNSVGIEICSWGGLVEKNGKFLTYAGNAINPNEVQAYPQGFRGYKFYQKYTNAQLENVRDLLRYLCDRYNIPKEFKGMGIFDISPACLCGEKGIWTHCSVRPASDKQDCHPQPELVQMLQSL